VRTKPGKGRVLARLGKGGCNIAFFNILLGLNLQLVDNVLDTFHSTGDLRSPLFLLTGLRLPA
jgi:hypothetical protein